MILKTVAQVIVTLAILFIVLGFVISPDIYGYSREIVEKDVKRPYVELRVTDEPDVTARFGKINTYSIDITGTVKYVGQAVDYLNILKEGIEIVPIIRFKGVSRKALINGEESFILDPEDTEKGGTFSVEISSKFPPITKFLYSSFANEEFKENDIFALRSAEGYNFSVSIDRIGKESILGRDIPLSRCVATLTVDCGSTKKLVDEIISCNDCEKENCLECQKVLYLCDDGIVSVKVDETNCMEKTTRLTVSVSGKSTLKAGNELSISFFRNTDCVKSWDSLEDIVLQCVDDLLGEETLNIENVRI